MSTYVLPADGPAFDPASAYAAGTQQVDRFNVLVLGRTGSGKSTLVNAVFEADLAPTGVGRPVTEQLRLHTVPGKPVGIYDAPGSELGTKARDLGREIREHVSSCASGDLSEQVHMALYCVPTVDGRLHPAEEALIQQVSTLGLPVLLVLTRASQGRDGRLTRSSAEMVSHLESLRLPVYGGRAHPVMAVPDAETGESMHGLDDLYESMLDAAPLAVRGALDRAAAKAVRRRAWERRRRAALVVVQASGAAAQTGDSDDLLEKLLADVAAIYRIEVNGVDRAAHTVVRVARTVWSTVRRASKQPVREFGPVADVLFEPAVIGVVGAVWIGVCEVLARGGLRTAEGSVDLERLRRGVEDELRRRWATDPGSTGKDRS